MGDQAEKIDSSETPGSEDVTEENLVEEVVEDDDEDAPQEKQLSQDEVNAIVAKQKARLKKTNEKLADENNQTAEELQLAKEKLKLYELALQQKNESKSGLPNPDDFDEGEHDPAYKKAVEDHNQKIIAETVESKLSEARKREAEEQSLSAKQQAEEARQTEHYKRVNSLKIADYIETEDKVLEILGEKAVTEIINNFDDAHSIFYYLGKNPAKAENLSNLLKSSPIKGVAELGRIQTELTVKSESPETPAPEEKLEGSTKSSSWQTKYDTIYKRYESGKATIQDVAKVKRDAKAAGVEL